MPNKVYIKVFIDEEQIRDYCIHHKLVRPKINLTKALFIGLSVLLCNVVVSYVLSQSALFNQWICLDILTNAELVIFGKQILKFIVCCYQHYAPEETRRKCTCKPSCSEYALLALNKYLWPKALWKIYHRVTYTCAQPGYHLDYP